MFVITPSEHAVLQRISRGEGSWSLDHTVLQSLINKGAVRIKVELCTNPVNPESMLDDETEDQI